MIRRLVLAGMTVALGAAQFVPAAAQPGAPTVIAVQLAEYSYAPSTIELNQGQPYVLHVTNIGKRAHDLSAKAFFQTVSLTPETTAVVRNGGIETSQGQSVDVAFTPNKPGTYEMHCTHPLHDVLGMKGQIIVH